MNSFMGRIGTTTALQTTETRSSRTARNRTGLPLREANSSTTRCPDSIFAKEECSFKWGFDIRRWIVNPVKDSISANCRAKASAVVEKGRYGLRSEERRVGKECS
jgi:hypothetical protein